ncbi:MAG: sensor histidine kinase [Candidatus Pristimantibacillus sp.]
MFYSLKSRLITSFVVLFVLSFAAMSILLFNESRNIIRSYIESSALEKMEEYGAYIDMVQMQVYDLASLVFNSDITKKWDNTISDPSVSSGEKMLSHIDLSEYLTQTTNSYTSVSTVAIYRQEGMWVSGENRVVTDRSFLEEQWYKEFKVSSTHWVPSHIDQVEAKRNNRHPVVSMLMPIGTFEPSHARNVMKININEDYFLEPLNRIHLGQSGTIYLLDHAGQPILSQSKFDMESDILQAIQSIRHGWDKQGVVYLDRASGAKDMLVYKKLERTDWMLIGFVSENDLYSELFKLRESILIIASLLLLLSIIIAIWLSHGISKPLSRLVSAMRHVQRGEFNYAEMRVPPEGSVRNEVGFVTATFRNMVIMLRQHIKNEFELKLLRQQAEYKALLMQINPHFLFNTLELMSSLAMQRRTDDTVQVIESLGKMMRFSLKMSDDLVRLEEELKYVRDYIAILQVRFGESLDVQMEKEGQLDNVTLIKFILQPLIENAVKYSFLKNAEAKVDIKVNRVDGQLLLQVADSGSGIPLEQRNQLLDNSTSTQFDKMLTSRSGQIGLGNVLARCRLYYGSLFEARIETSRYGGTLIELKLPIQEEIAYVPRTDC